MEHCKGTNRHAHHSDDLKRSLVNRTKRIEGQIRGIGKMIEEDVYCDDIITQIMAVRSALNALSQKLFEAHLNSCILEQITSGSPEVMNELMETVRKMQRI